MEPDPTSALNMRSPIHDVGLLSRNIAANVLRRNDREGDWIDREDEEIDHDMRVERSERTRPVRLLL